MSLSYFATAMPMSEAVRRYEQALKTASATIRHTLCGLRDPGRTPASVAIELRQVSPAST